VPSYYEIRVAGVLPPEALLDFDRLTASVEPVETVVHGPLQDQAALGGLLARFELYGVQVLEVRRVHGADPPAEAADNDVLPKGKAMDSGPVELIVLVFPGEGADPAVTEVLTEVTSGGQITVLDLAVLTRTPDGLVRTTDVHQNLDDIGFGSLVITAQPVITQDDLDTVRASLEPGKSAAIVAFEHSWTRRLAVAAENAGGAVIRTDAISGTGAAAVAESEAAVREAEAAVAEAERAAEQYSTIRPQPSATGGNDLLGQLAELARLRDAGALSEAEFEAAKVRLLSS
jgi:hypothetical protein